MRSVSKVMLLALLLGLSVALAACTGAGAGSRKGFTGEFQQVALSNAPAELQQYYEQMKSAPGLFVLERNRETYLLLVVGKAERLGMKLEVVSAQRTNRAGEIRLLAQLRPGQGTEPYPCAVVRLAAPAGTEYKARVRDSSGDGQELRGIPIVDR